jgi:hypothetical protein
MMVDLGCVAQRGLDGGRCLMNSRSVMAPSGVMVASTAGKMKIMQILILKMVMTASVASAKGAH